MRDADVRRALLSSLVATHWGEDVLLREELGLDYGTVRADVATIGRELHGYELKSDRDTLARLPRQVDAYCAVFDRVTLVAGLRHLQPSLALVPSWWGVEVATAQPGGVVHLRTERQAQPNPGRRPLSLARLLWRDEALALLEQHGVARGLRSKSRETMCQRLVAALSPEDLGTAVRAALRARRDW